ncbi:MAG: hypothetical protein E6I31_10175 [Chloroflexi bacterium]|nr:MAG: hypothetical protein E6I31_10175 [Chloroflexota bacterium]
MAALWAGKLTASLSRGLRRGGGTTLPGDVSRWVDPKILTTLSRSLDQGAVVVTGTNGKTTTAALLRHILEAEGRRTVANQAGANLIYGVTAAIGDDGGAHPARAGKGPRGCDRRAQRRRSDGGGAGRRTAAGRVCRAGRSNIAAAGAEPWRRREILSALRQPIRLRRCLFWPRRPLSLPARRLCPAVARRQSHVGCHRGHGTDASADQRGRARGRRRHPSLRPVQRLQRRPGDSGGPGAGGSARAQRRSAAGLHPGVRADGAHHDRRSTGGTPAREEPHRVQ